MARKFDWGLAAAGLGQGLSRLARLMQEEDARKREEARLEKRQTKEFGRQQEASLKLIEERDRLARERQEAQWAHDKTMFELQDPVKLSPGAKGPFGLPVNPMDVGPLQGLPLRKSDLVGLMEQQAEYKKAIDTAKIYAGGRQEGRTDPTLLDMRRQQAIEADRIARAEEALSGKVGGPFDEVDYMRSYGKEAEFYDAAARHEGPLVNLIQQFSPERLNPNDVAKMLNVLELQDKWSTGYFDPQYEDFEKRIKKTRKILQKAADAESITREQFEQLAFTLGMHTAGLHSLLAGVKFPEPPREEEDVDDLLRDAETIPGI